MRSKQLKHKLLITISIIFAAICTLTTANSIATWKQQTRTYLENPALLDITKKQSLTKLQNEHWLQRKNSLENLANCFDAYLLDQPEQARNFCDKIKKTNYINCLVRDITQKELTQLILFCENQLAYTNYTAAPRTHECTDCQGIGWTICRECKANQEDSENCPSCSGLGLTKCTTCNGHGLIIPTQDNAPNQFQDNLPPEIKKIHILIQKARYLASGAPDYFTTKGKTTAPEIQSKHLNPTTN